MPTVLSHNSHDRNNRRTRVILLRHGQSTYNSLGLYQGCSDRPSLTELGRHQAQLTGEFLQGVSFDVVYASPLQRAMETAIEILQTIIDPITTHLHVNIAHQLRETDLPNWQGLPFQFVKEEFPEAYRCWKHTPHQFWMEAGESEETEADTTSGNQPPNAKQKFFPALDLYDRVQQFWQEILPRHVGQTILIVCHGGTNRALISTALGITPDRYHAIEQSNCALSILNFSEGRLESGQLEVMNSATHVGETLPQIKEGETGQRLFLIPAEISDRHQMLNLIHMLKSEAINFSINTDRSHKIARQILQYHPKAIQLEALREDFLQLWQRSLDIKNQAPCDRLHTGIVVARRDSISHFIERVLGITNTQSGRLSIQTGTTSVIRYPGSGQPPLLQAMNVDRSDRWRDRLRFVNSKIELPFAAS
jgi:phosphoserine phosphatase